MNALVLSAIFGVVMMFSGAFIKKNAPVKVIGLIAMLLLLLVNYLEMQGKLLFRFDVSNFMAFDSYALFF